MSTEQPEQPISSTPEEDFLAPPVDSPPTRTRTGWWQTQRAQGSLLVITGLILGGVAVSIVDSQSSASTTSASSNQRLPFGGQGFQPPGQGLPGGGFGGLNGEQHITGTLVSVGSSSITVRSSSGTATYAVTATTQIVRKGQPATLSDLHVGDSVFVHVYPSGGRLLVERIFDQG